MQIIAQCIFPALAIVVFLQFSFPQTLVADSMADMVWVQKSERTLYLLKDYKVIRSYPIALGKNPRGHKLATGDSRTPEGLYLIDWRNPDSMFHLSLHISYPNENDIRRARYKNIDAGGGIMIHGYSDTIVEGGWSTLKYDWTDGCIALSNYYVEEIWRLIADGSPILIDP